MRKLDVLVLAFLALTCTNSTCYRNYCEKYPTDPVCVSPSPSPTPTPSPLPTDSTPTPTPTPTATPTSTATPTPISTPFQKPILYAWKVGEFCKNPTDGPKFKANWCQFDSTELLAPDEDHLNQGGPCDEDHQTNWNTFCGQRDWDDPRGPDRVVTGDITGWEIDESNPFQTWVQFIPGKQFTICTEPLADAHTSDGIPIDVLRPARRCTTKTLP